MKLANPEYSASLRYVEAFRKDTAVYIITATNEYGSDSAEIEVVVLGPPSRPKGPLEVSDVTKNGCKLKWNKPEDDGGLPIT